MSEVTIIIPTYNAKDCIIDTISLVKEKAPTSRIIVVDDNSPDKTADLIQSKFPKDKNLKVIIRGAKAGRGSAVITGLKEGLKDKNIGYFIEMDSDLCHDPKYIKPLVEKCRNADLVIASRYLPGSRIYGWSLKRKIMSFMINTFAKIFLGLKITDYTDGFRCYSRRAVELITRHKFRSKGYIVLSEIAFICQRKNLKLVEIPIDFNFKSPTKSNLGLNEVKEALATIIKLSLLRLK